MEKYLSKIQPKHYGLVAFVLTCLSMYMMFSYEEVLSTGRYIIMEGDLFHQYVPFIKMFVRDILQGENPFFSWSLSMGMNTSLCYAYYVLSPFNLLYLILYGVDENIVTAIVIILKSGLAAFLFQRFVARHLKCTGVESIVFAICYAMCSFQVIFNVIHIAWMDALYLLPLLCGLLISFVKEGKWKALVITYVYLFVVQFYMAYIVGFFSLLFLLCVIVCSTEIKVKKTVIMFLKYIGIVLLAIGATAVIWLPAILFLIGNVVPTEASVALELTVFDVIKNMFWGQMQGYEGIYPYVYCGVPALILLPLFWGNKKICLKYRVWGGILLFVLFCFMLIEPLYFFIHAFDVPNQFGFRFAFLISFLLCCIGCYQYRNADRHFTKGMLCIPGVAILLYALAVIINGNNDSSGADWFPLMVSVAFMLGWIGSMWLLQKKTQKKVLVAVFCVFLVMVELVSNGYVCFQYSGPETHDRQYTNYRNSIDYAMQELEQDQSFYRVIYYNDFNDNSDSWFGYNGMTDFNSSMNVVHQKAMRNLGHISGGNMNYTVGNTPVTRMLFGVKYLIYGIHPNMTAVQMPDPSIAMCEQVLSLGYMVDEAVLDCGMADNYVFDNMDAVLSSMIGKKTDCFQEIPEEMIDITEENATLKFEDNMFAIYRASENEDCGYVRYSVSGEPGQTAYVQFVREHIYFSDQSPILLGGIENSIEDMGCLTASYAKELIPVENGYEVVVEMRPEHVPMIRYESADFFYLNRSELDKAYDILSQNQMNVEEYANGYVKANVTVPQEKTVLFTSIPYDEGWTVYADGVETQTVAVIDDAFLALELEPGYHDLEFRYEVPGAKMGMGVSAVSVGIFAIFVITDYIKKRKNKAKEGTIEPDVEDRTE
ncbi:MAG: YfhO family protein [Lachnospiraceae bacterium]|nr:YfhO family protein [Lachnospiraceae bacterium]